MNLTLCDHIVKTIQLNILIHDILAENNIDNL